MSDIYDRATEAEERHRDEALRNQAARTAAPVTTNWEGAAAKWGVGASCGQRIPDERRRAIPGVKFCVECQDRREQEERRKR